MAEQSSRTRRGEVVETLTLAELCRSCGVHAEWIVELVDEGILEPEGTDVSSWRFSGISIVKTRTAWRLRQDTRRWAIVRIGQEHLTVSPMVRTAPMTAEPDG